MPLVTWIAAWIAANWRAITIGGTIFDIARRLVDSGFEAVVNKWIVSEAAERAGLYLNPDAPLSDESISSALSERVGFTIRTLKDRESIKMDLLDGAASIVREKTGIPVRSFYDKEMILEDLEGYALGEIEKRTKIRLSTLRDVEKLREDFIRIGGGVITQQAGIPLSDITDPERIKLDVMDWAKDQAMIEIGESVNTAVAAEWKQGVTMLAMVRERLGKKVSPKALLRGINDAMVGKYMMKIDGAADAPLSKAEQRRLQNKLAQRRFRARGDRDSPSWDGRKGGKSTYVPKGWDSKTTAPETPVSKRKRLGGGRTVGLKR